MKVLILPLLLFLISGAWAGKKSDDINVVLTNWKKRPELRFWPGFDTGKPVMVKVSMLIYKFHGTPAEKGTIAYEGYLAIRWTDPRLKFKSSLGRIMVDAEEFSKYIWIPQILYPTTTNVDFASMGADILMKIRPKGRVVIMRRFVAELDCYMKFNKFPFDNQTCNMYLFHIGYRHEEVQLRWGRHAVLPSEHPMFRLTNTTVINSVTNYTFLWQYMSTQLQITRNHGHYVSTWYVPTIFIIGLVYIAFWMPETYLLAKTLLTTALYLSYVWLMVSSEKEGPKVPYMTEFDKWFLVNLLFMTFAILEVLVLHLVRAYVRGDVKVEDFQTKKEEGQDDAAASSPNALLFALDSKLRVIRGVNWGFRITFPVGYILFLIIYFAMNKT